VGLYGRALNRSLACTRGEIIVFLSAHTPPVTKRWLSELVLPLENDGKSVSYGRQIPMPGANRLEEWASIRAFPKRVSVMGLALGIHRPTFSNANAAITKRLLEKESFCEDMAFAEDKEWYARVRAKGEAVAYCPDAAVYHSHPPEGVEERMESVGRGMRQRGDGSIYRSGGLCWAAKWATMSFDLGYCLSKGYWDAIPGIRDYRNRYFAGLVKGLE
jgi:cellulose synthase/poly-beta-1,6-N-acetylglucosamine synthase-like glycosyltransferase